MPDEQLRDQVEALASQTPPPAAELSRMSPKLLPALSWGALSHPNAALRRMCLDYLDHLAVAASGEVFVAALEDPVPRVRRHAIHALTCEVCKEQPLCTDVLTPLRRLIAADPNAKVRFEALRALLWRVDPETGAAAIEQVVACGDQDLLVEAMRAKPRSVPASLRIRANQVLVT